MEDVKALRSTTDLTKLLAVSVGHFANDFYMNLVPPILFLFVAALSLNLTQQGIISAVITVSGTFAQPVVGYLMDKKGEPWLLILSVAWIGFWMGISATVGNYYLLLITLSLGALGSAVFHPLGSGIAVKLGKRSKGTSLSVFMTVGGFAFALSPIVAMPIATTYGLGKLAYLMIPGFIVAGGMYWAQIHKVEIQHHGGAKKKEHTKLNAYTLKWVGAQVYIGTIKNLVRTALITFGVQLMLLKDIDLKIATLVISLYLLIISIGTITGGYLSDKFGNKKIMILGNLLVTMGVILVIWGGEISSIFAFILIGFSLSGSNTANIVLTQDLIPKNMNLATGLIMGLGGGLGGFGILIYGRMADTQGLIMATMMLLIPLVLVNILTLFLPNKTNHEEINAME